MADLASDIAVAEPMKGLIDGHFAIDFAAPLPDAAGGQPAFAVRSSRNGSGFMAIQVEPGWPVREAALTSLMAAPIPNLLVPFAHGVAAIPSGEEGYFVVCQTPAGKPLGTDLQPWSDADLIDMLLRPAALLLSELHGRGITHRAIRANNVFRAGRMDVVTLGSAWAAPPACRQPCIYEPPYVAVCLRAGRGEGAPADDIYALGVLLLVLALGRDPLSGVANDVIIRSKLDQGSYAAILGTNRVSTAVAELARGMLADDPEHRPSALLLADPAAARARRAAARPPRRAQRAFPLGDPPALTARDIARAIMVQPEQSITQLRNGAIGSWLRRGIGDVAMAGRLDEVCGARDSGSFKEEPRADAMLAACAVAVLDPLAPLTWRRLSIWPDGLGAALNHALQNKPERVLELAEITLAEVPMAFGTLRPGRSDIAALRTDARRSQAALAVKQIEHGALRLNYTLNPLAPCQSPLLAGRWVTKLGELLPALEVAAAGTLRDKLPPVDRHITAFIGVRRDEQAQPELGTLANLVSPTDPMSQLRVLAHLQERTQPGKLPALTGWLTEIVTPVTARFQSQSRRTKLATALAELGRGGMLIPLVELLDNAVIFAQDRQGHQAAITRIAQIDHEIRRATQVISARQAQAASVANNITSGISLAACGIALAVAVFL